MKLCNALMAGLILLLPACSDESGDGTVDLPACEVHTENGTEDPGYKTWECSMSEPCPDVLFLGPYAGMSGMMETPRFDDIKAAQCVLTALRDRTPGAVTYKREDCPLPGQCTTTETIFVLGEDKALSNWSQTMDIGYEGNVKNRARMKPASYFDGCLAMTDELAMYDCLASWSDGCIEELLRCP